MVTGLSTAYGSTPSPLQPYQAIQLPNGRQVMPVINLKSPAEAAEAARRDVFRESWVRYFGYTNELGEALRSVIGNNWAHRSYYVAGLYAVTDMLVKGREAFKENKRASLADRLYHAVGGIMDAGVFHYFATITVPPQVIRMVQEATEKRMSARFAKTLLGKALPVGIGLAITPLIIKPIDMATEKFLDLAVRPLLGRKPYFKGDIPVHTHYKAAPTAEMMFHSPLERSQFFGNVFA
jgi:mitochondrial fission process protein 1